LFPKSRRELATERVNNITLFCSLIARGDRDQIVATRRNISLGDLHRPCPMPAVRNAYKVVRFMLGTF